MRKKMRIFLIIIGVIVVILVVKAVLFFTAKPKIVVDYLAKINALNKPLDYDPNKDGFKYLMEASDLYIKAPLGLDRNLWPHEMNDTEIALLRQWLIANYNAFDAYRKAGECDYIWMKLKENSGNDSSRWWPENEIDVRWCLSCNAKLKAFGGNFDEALESLLAKWNVAVKSTNPNYPLGWQMNGLSFQQDVLNTAIEIADVYRPPAADLEKWQKKWQEQFDLDSYVPGFEGVRLDYYDIIQQAFVYKNNGSGRLYWKDMAKYVPTCDCEDSCILTELLIPFTGPTESDMHSRIDFMINRYTDLVLLTPSEVRYPEQQYVQAQENYKRNHRMWELLDYFVPPLHSFTTFYYRVKMRQNALITILAILRFNSQHGHYPSNLAELVNEGFLIDLPCDPFSRGSLMYIQLNDDFGLYSVGPDFADDGGRRGAGSNSLTGTRYGDEVFWPPLRKGRKNINSFDVKILKRFGPY